MFKRPKQGAPGALAAQAPNQTHERSDLAKMEEYDSPVEADRPLREAERSFVLILLALLVVAGAKTGVSIGLHAAPTAAPNYLQWIGSAGSFLLLASGFAAVPVLFSALLKHFSAERSLRYLRTRRELIGAFTAALDHSPLNPDADQRAGRPSRSG
jgi:hypothetical protein